MLFITSPKELVYLFQNTQVSSLLLNDLATFSWGVREYNINFCIILYALFVLGYVAWGKHHIHMPPYLFYIPLHSYDTYFDVFFDSTHTCTILSPSASLRSYGSFGYLHKVISFLFQPPSVRAISPGKKKRTAVMLLPQLFASEAMTGRLRSQTRI